MSFSPPVHLNIQASCRVVETIAVALTPVHISFMSWAKFAIGALRRGETVQIRPRGHSMRGKVNDGDLVTIEPCDPSILQPDDILLVRVKGRDYLHLIKAINGARFQIGNNRGHINGWVGHNCIYGKATRIER